MVTLINISSEKIKVDGFYEFYKILGIYVFLLVYLCVCVSFNAFILWSRTLFILIIQ